MTTTKKKIKLALPPTTTPPVISNTAMQDMINKGGTTLIKVEEKPQEDKLKSFTFKIYESELSKIRDIQNRLPKRDRLSIHDFVLAGVLEKVKKEF
jgi:hypothetical protein